MLIALLSFVFLASCSGNNNSISGDFELPRSIPDTSSYDLIKKSIEQERKALNALRIQNLCTIDSAGIVFTHRLVNGIIPYWYGTAWDYNGYSDVPKQGQIACGYLVSTTLKHAGIRVNRYKMAQKSAMDGALMLEPKNQLDIEYTNRDSFITRFLRKKKDGLYMIGLSNHVGFLYKTNKEAYFIHSTYLQPSMVMCEKAMESGAMAYSTIFVLADITHNRKLILKWLTEETLQH